LAKSSITISDDPLSSETNYRTEFVVVLNNQPQGGFANRARSPDMIARSQDGFGFGNWFGNGSGNGYGSYGYSNNPPPRQPPRGQSYYPSRFYWSN
jgi:hypothetical protein